MAPHIEIIGRERCQLGESPVWDPLLKRLFWVDARAPAIWSYDPETGDQTSLSAPDMVGSIVLGETGRLVAGLRHEVCRVDLAAGVFTPLARPAAMLAEERLNDGKTDRAGRYLTGSQHHADGGRPEGRLYRFDRGGACEVLETGVEISNSICFSPSGDRLYFADSLRQAIWTYAYDLETGQVGPRETLIDTAPLNSAPDGATVDAEGRLWVALVQSGQIACITPDGNLERLIDCPVPFPSCPAFGGESLDVLYVTAISDSGGRLNTDHPAGGRLFAIEGLGARGIAETRCRL
ncbi:MAG: SMP-30/gluconolactonase/LRE family protein [Phenylobacterium sp.]|uniref:SMP-30/gluconolactonase/LRE family protein n=1 Tax=Phenylobacterium sp. TaxID=1871053 RepID=UPI0027373334|nr:SMP-30/gluconolactonase/LRE family protein [Phenylobacterium sp.]MDP3745733.1 SMP-30/gluconolactonase/LRE family protein [Phenylobacterium sp.]